MTTSAFGALDNHLTTKDNPAVALSFGVFLFSVCLILTGPRTPSDPDDDPIDTMVSQVIWSGIGITLLGICWVFNDKIIFRKANLKVL